MRESKMSSKKLSFTIYELKDSLPKSSRTSRLQINYMNYINIVKTFIRAEKTDNWHLLPTWLIFSRLLTTNMIDLFEGTYYQHG